jgi:probable HAF family extracellular repeat protein
MFPSRKSQLLFLSLTFGFILFVSPPEAFAQYTVTDLSTITPPGYDYVNINDLNNAGQIVGGLVKRSSSGQILASSAFIYSNGVVTDLGSLPGYPRTQAIAINDHGEIVGVAADANGGNPRAFLYSNGLMTDLGTFGYYDVAVSGINNSGQIIGRVREPINFPYTFRNYAFLYSNGVFNLLTYPGFPDSFPFDINDSGQVVGIFLDPTRITPAGMPDGYRCFLYSNGTMTEISQPQSVINFQGGYHYCYPSSINNNGEVVGTFNAPVSGDVAVRAFYYSNGVISDLGIYPGQVAANPTTLSSIAAEINDSGKIVGISDKAITPFSRVSHAMIFENGIITDINDLFFLGPVSTLNGAYRINNAGQIIAYADSGGPFGTRRVFLLTPISVPLVTITGPQSGQIYSVDTPVTFSGSFLDDDFAGHTAVWSFNSINQAATVDDASRNISTTYTFTSAGVYLVSLAVTDPHGNTGTSNTVNGLTAMVVVYDPDGGYVTGGGWIDSPAGAYTPDPTLTGRANFGFVSRYDRGATVPSGNTQFIFQTARLNFQSTSYDWLVVSGARVQYRGSGTINGRGNYGFILTAVDGEVNGGGGVDKFRIKIWDNATGAVVYDNKMGVADTADPTAIAGGSVVIHSN